jgi:hypothetical protein
MEKQGADHSSESGAPGSVAGVACADGGHQHGAPREEEANQNEELARDIGYALAKSPLRPKGHTAIDACLSAAAHVVAHLRLCGWLIARKPPVASHGTPGPSRDTALRDAAAPCTTLTVHPYKSKE